MHNITFSVPNRIWRTNLCSDLVKAGYTIDNNNMKGIVVVYFDSLNEIINIEGIAVKHLPR